MDFICQIFGKFFLFFICVGQLFSKVHGGTVHYPTYGKYVDEVINAFAKEMKKAGFRCTLTGGGMPYDVRELDIGFAIHQKGSIETGREKMIFLIEKFLEAINGHEGIRPYLREYPFPESRVHLSLNFCKPDNHDYKDGSITDVYHARSMIIYMVSDPDYKKPATKIFEEPLAEAFALVNKTVQVNHVPNKGGPSSNQQTHVTIIPSRKRLGTLVKDCTGFTPGRELEALGIQDPAGQKEMASDIGELIGGICDLYFGEEFLERLAQAVAQNPDGEYVEYWDNGQIKARIPYKNGHAEGHIHAWYPDGWGAFKGYYKDGKRVGIQLASYSREVLEGLDPLGRVLEYDMEGKLHRNQITFSSDGALLASMYYEHGALHGSTSLYAGTKRGDCVGEWEYKKGKLIKTKIPAQK